REAVNAATVKSSVDHRSHLAGGLHTLHDLRDQSWTSMCLSLSVNRDCLACPVWFFLADRASR
ncbi:MAG TPA: hypothetical protein VKR06_43190, partial [Ktedonosporobacter sp.]|nr:hypothetical protein [Ktedonosporobacter sp.]